MSEEFLDDDLDIFVDNEQIRRDDKDDTLKQSQPSTLVGFYNYIYSSIFGVENSNREKSEGYGVTDLRQSTISGFKKSDLRQLSIVKFGGNAGVRRLKGESQYIQSNEADNKKPRLLCLHGWRSNSEITRIHLDHLRISDKFHKDFLNGPIQSNEPADNAIGILTPGPYYSWAAQDQQEGTEINVKEVIENLKSLLLHLLLVPGSHDDACYDAVYGFSQAVSLITLLSLESVRNCVLKEMGMPPMIRQPWKFVIASCGANMNIFKKVLKHYRIHLGSVKVSIPSIHIIGIHDPFKLQSEELLLMFEYEKSLPFYLDSGHEIPAITQRLDYLSNEIMDWFSECHIQISPLQHVEQGLRWSGNNTSMTDIAYEIHEFTSETFNNGSKDVGTLEIGAFGQYVLNKIATSHNNLLDMLKDAKPESIALYAPGASPLTYGALLEFIQGEGDLRKIGATKKYTVAYLAPLGVVSAMAFLTFSSQCTAAPLDPAYNETTLLLALKQLKPDIVVSFDGVDTDNIKNAAAKMNIKTTHAKVKSGSCGLFSFEKTLETIDASIPRLENDPDNTALILRTSGTTSEPKVCALKMCSIVSNSRIIAKNLGLKSEDTALNAMPLFHIGGLSANLLSSIAAGGSVILMPKFDVEDFFHILTSPVKKKPLGWHSGINVNLPRPTWFSAVPTMHSAIQQYAETSDEKLSTSLRFIRSGAAAMPADLANRMEETFKCPLILTYSMTEQMPISQPPTGFSIPKNKPNSVGQPVGPSICIVDKNYRPIPYHEAGEKNGEICISGPMVLEEYSANPSANAASYFYLGGMKWFRTGDMGHLDKDGFLFLSGRNKELIKRGGEQVSPYEVEDACYLHNAIKTCIVFAVPSSLWGEQVGAAIVLKKKYLNQDKSTLKRELRSMLLDTGLEQHKFPEIIEFVEEEQLLKTRSNKYIRIGLAKHLGLPNIGKSVDVNLNDMKNVSISEGATGARFILALAVMYAHIGNFNNWSRSDYLLENASQRLKGWSHTRYWCFHTPIFFMVGGFFLSAGTHSPITNRKDLRSFYSLRIASLHPMYLVSILLSLITFLCRCGPLNYIQEFERIQEPINGQTFVCQATPVEMPWLMTLLTTLFTYGFALQSWLFFIPISWFISSYTWFSSVYIFCIFVFPWCHKQFYEVKDDVGRIFRLSIFWVFMLYLYVGIFSMVFVFMFYDDEVFQNYWTLAGYLLPIGWLPCFALGIALYFLFRYYHPGEKKSAWIWGMITDLLSVAFLACWLFYGFFPQKSTPGFVNSSLTNRFFGAYLSRVLCPIGFLWFWGIAVGKGLTSWIFSNRIFVSWLAPASYNMFLFHQPISEVYYFLTRGEWWAYPKPFYWFSPYAYPVSSWEFPIVVVITVIFSVIMETYVNELLIRFCIFLLNKFSGVIPSQVDIEGSTEEIIIRIINELTYSNTITKETTLSEAGLSSMTTILLVGELKKNFAGLRLSARDCAGSVTVLELAKLITGRINESKVRPDLALTNRTSVFVQEVKEDLGTRPGTRPGTQNSVRRTSFVRRNSITSTY